MDRAIVYIYFLHPPSLTTDLTIDVPPCFFPTTVSLHTEADVDENSRG